MKYNKGFASLVLIAIIVGVLVVGGGIYYLSSNTIKNKKEVKKEENNLPQENKNITTNNQPTIESSSLNETNPIKKEQEGPIKLLSLVNGQELISGSTISVKYEITSDNITGMLLVSGNAGGDGDGGCTEMISGKLKGVYSVECKIQKRLGPISATAGDLTNKTNLENNNIDLEVVAPKNVKPIEITYGPQNYLFGIVGNDAPYITVSIKYSDGVTRDIPFTYLKYSLDDPSLISFVHTEKITNTYAQHYIANKGGETILHLEYQGLKKDIPVKACSMTGNDYPC